MALHIDTPPLASTALRGCVGGSVWLKMEALQPSGSFKLRGIGHACEVNAARGARRIVGEDSAHVQSLLGPHDAFIHPFDDSLLWEGHAGMIDEVAAGSLRPDAVVRDGLRRRAGAGLPGGRPAVRVQERPRHRLRRCYCDGGAAALGRPNAKRVALWRVTGVVRLIRVGSGAHPTRHAMSSGCARSRHWRYL